MGEGGGGLIPVFDLGGMVLEVPAPVRLHLKFLALTFVVLCSIL